MQVVCGAKSCGEWGPGVVMVVGVFQYAETVDLSVLEDIVLARDRAL